MKPTVTAINDSISKNAESFITECEERYHGEIRFLVDDIKRNNKKLIMLAGPSGSGKTTTAHILCDCLKDSGIKTTVISLDDFYLNADKAPLTEDGKPDFETVFALDIPEINRCFSDILQNGICVMPKFDFVRRVRSEVGQTVNVADGVLIAEGLHALNPLLFGTLPTESVFKVYISVNESVYDDDGEKLLSSRQLRLIRRISRDSIYRGSDPTQTFTMWENVIRGEEKYLYCHKASADRLITTLHRYEPCVFRDSAVSLLSKIDPSVEDYEYAEKTLKGLERFLPISHSAVPMDSLIREFISGGKYE